MQLKAVWEFLKLLPFFIDIYKSLKVKAGDMKVDHYVNNFMKEVKGDNNASAKAQHLNDMFK